MKKVPLLVVMFVALVFSGSAFAAGYGAAGCGFGSMVIPENKILHQVGAWFLNSISGNQTFGITSGTSNCGGSGLVLAEKEQEVYVENNFQTLAKEMAAGEGEDLRTLAGMLGCSPAQIEGFGSFTQENYESIFSQAGTTPTEMLGALKARLSEDEAMATSCTNI